MSDHQDQQPNEREAQQYQGDGVPREEIPTDAPPMEAEYQEAQQYQGDGVPREEIPTDAPPMEAEYQLFFQGNDPEAEILYFPDDQENVIPVIEIDIEQFLMLDQQLLFARSNRG
ncbi:hypothetical protein Pmani_004028 [Petrolisthes manimaculis]|uniref:Uncharacterized protein n=1 Tax=Petrolisthes manimaculis TaxID=1843537 RepID=A0AAE1QHD0_9EUCA|nr:hypothetical protein Pmani_004028 [Petrolisthes manimaculis]